MRKAFERSVSARGAVWYREELRGHRNMISAQMPLLTNVVIYRSIADEAYREMSADMAANFRPGPEGSDVVIKTFDPR